ncbi:hypothetical protein N617_gp31 [Stygiolobus rod-shaped virus]|uniref:Uncharacterized protein n=1 Tax=Stygiolobus rod-shaped virus TaxID=537009 RepID=B6EFD7_9VIRU|nr:hypothetical protein N617_gp31 [Stygiolobus rod-shaped virus]CAQ58472.1 hypothetical protein [Stygiolobus rod-shaped virus]
MLIYTFVGYCQHLDELDFDYVIIDKYFNNCSPEQLEKYKDKIIWNETNEQDLRLRIKKQLLKIIEHMETTKDEYLAIIDSDLIIPNLRNMNIGVGLFSPCYYALHKGKGYIAPWCFGTNFIFNRIWLPYLKAVISSYDNPGEPIDGYIHFHMPISHILIPGTRHFIKVEGGEIEKSITENNLTETIHHNFIPVRVWK